MEGVKTGRVLSRTGAMGRVEVDGRQVEVMFDELPRVAPGQVVVMRDGRAIGLAGAEEAADASTPPEDFTEHPENAPPDESAAWADGPWPKRRVCCEEWLG